jgi:hypothetical protein
MLLEQAWALSRQDQGSEAANCIEALSWRLRASEEWIASRAKSQTNGMDAAMRCYGKRLGELIRQYPFNPDYALRRTIWV